MRIENKCEEESYISFDMHTHARMHTHYGSAHCRKETLASNCIISLKTIKSAAARTISHYIPWY